jgi:Leucine Rich repeats (2 copies)
VKLRPWTDAAALATGASDGVAADAALKAGELVPAKLLGRMAAALALVILILAQTGILDLALSRIFGVDLWLNPLSRLGVFGALPVSVAVVQLLAEWRARGWVSHWYRFALYAAPTLLVLTVATAAWTVAHSGATDDRARAKLEEVGIDLEGREGGMLAVRARIPTPDSDLPWARRALQYFSSRIIEANLSQLELLRCDNSEACFSRLQAFTLQWGSPASPDGLAALAKLTTLQHLSLAGSQIADLVPLARLAGLHRLDLSRTPVVDLTPLAGLTALRELQLSNTPVTDFTPLAGLTALHTLDLSGTQIADLTPLAELTALQELQLSNTPVADLTPLAGLTALHTLDLSGTQIADLAPLAGLGGLQRLGLWNTRVADLAPLASLGDLRELNLRNTRIVEVAPLAGLTALRQLNLSGTRAVDLTPLQLSELLVRHSRPRSMLKLPPEAASWHLLLPGKM